jgi:hypothetical protein
MIRNVVFDVGGVLLRLRYQPFVRYLQDAGVDLADLPAWLASIDLDAHERGEVSGEELLGRVAASAVKPLDPDEHRPGRARAGRSQRGGTAGPCRRVGGEAA